MPGRHDSQEKMRQKGTILYHDNLSQFMFMGIDKINQMIEDFIEAKKLSGEKYSAERFAEIIGMKGGTFRRKLNGSRPWWPHELERIAEVLGISKTRMLLQDARTDFQIPTPIIQLPAVYEKVPEGIRTEEYVFIPMVSGEIAAGTAGRIPENYIEHLICVFKPALGRRSIDELRAVTLAQDARSMEPTLRPGDIVIIDPLDKPPFNPIPKKGEKNVYAINLDQEGYCAIKRVFDANDSWVLISDNPDYHPIILHKTEINPFVGRVIWSWTSWV